MRKNFGAKPFLYPQAVFIIGSYDENGNANAMNAAWGGVADADKIFICISKHKTTDNILARKAFTVSMGTADKVVACDYVGIVSANNEPDKMKKAGFKVRDQSQRYVEKTEAFREIENKYIEQKFYYLHNKAYEYCIENVHAIEDGDEFVRFEKVEPTQRIDLFDADVIATKQMLIDIEKSQKASSWLD